jgi:hypothetical protein
VRTGSTVPTFSWKLSTLTAIFFRDACTHLIPKGVCARIPPIHGPSRRIAFLPLTAGGEVRLDGPVVLPLEDPATRKDHSMRIIPSPASHRIALFGLLGGILLLTGTQGCSTRASKPTMAPDSTMVYASKIPGDVSATITFSLKDSKKREEAKRLERERLRQEREKAKELARLKREAERKAALERRKAEAEAKAKAKKEARAKKKKGKKGKAAEGEAPSSPTPSKRDREPKQAVAPPPDNGPSQEAGANPPAVRAPADSEASAPPTKLKKDPEAEERAFDLEEGAKVQAQIKLENTGGRGKLPLLIHLVWIQPNQKAAYRKMLVYTPNDSSNVITSVLTISPAKRAPGIYSFRAYLFRELMAEKTFELRGTALAPQEKENADM